MHIWVSCIFFNNVITCRSYQINVLSNLWCKLIHPFVLILEFFFQYVNWIDVDNYFEWELIKINYGVNWIRDEIPILLW